MALMPQPSLWRQQQLARLLTDEMTRIMQQKYQGEMMHISRNMVATQLIVHTPSTAELVLTQPLYQRSDLL